VKSLGNKIARLWHGICRYNGKTKKKGEKKMEVIKKENTVSYNCREALRLLDDTILWLNYAILKVNIEDHLPKTEKETNMHTAAVIRAVLNEAGENLCSIASKLTGF